MKPRVSTFTIYTDDIQASIRFYETILGIQTEISSDDYAAIPIAKNLSLSLWNKNMVEPATSLTTSTPFELTLQLDTDKEVDAYYQHCLSLNLPTTQEPKQMGFGRNFMLSDPDGNRVRIFSPESAIY